MTKRSHSYVIYNLNCPLKIKYDHQGAVRDVVIGARRDLHGRAVGEAVAEVHGLALRLGLVGVQQDEVGEQALLEEPEGDGRAYKTAADDGRFSRVYIHFKTLLFSGMTIVVPRF